METQLLKARAYESYQSTQWPLLQEWKHLLLLCFYTNLLFFFLFDMECVWGYHENDRTPVTRGWQQFTGSTVAGQDTSIRLAEKLPTSTSLIPGAWPPSASPIFVSSYGCGPGFHFYQLKKGKLGLRTSWIPGAEGYTESHIHHLRGGGQSVCVCVGACVSFHTGGQLCKG